MTLCARCLSRAGPSSLRARATNQAAQPPPLTNRGARVICAPLIQVVPPKSWKSLDRALTNLHRYEAVAFTSVNAVDFFFLRCRKLLGRKPVPPRVLAVVGAQRRTPSPQMAGVVPSCLRTPRRGLARILRVSRGGRVLIPSAERGLDVLAKSLRAAGARVTVAVAYRTVADALGRRTLRRALALGADAVTFASGSAAVLGAHDVALSGAAAISIGPTTAVSSPLSGRRSRRRRQASRPRVVRRGRRVRVTGPPMTRASLLKTTLLRAGQVLSRHFGKVSYKQKRRADLLTIADLESQKTILDAIRRAFPGDDFKAEEDEVKLTGADYLWIIDPLDGTTNYAHGYPAFCVSIGVLKKAKRFWGGVYDPFRKELFLARKGRGTTLNGNELRVSRTRRITDSLLITGFAYDRAERADFYLARFKAFMTRCHDVRRSGSVRPRHGVDRGRTRGRILGVRIESLGRR